MKVTMFWFGGSSYACPSDSDGEPFASISEAVSEFRRRFEGHDSMYPCVDENCNAWIVIGNPNEATMENGPDLVLEIGPRGGVRINRLR